MTDNGDSINPMPKSWSDWVSLLLKMAIVIMMYLGTAGLGLEMALWQKNAPLIWPPAGIALAVVYLYGFRYLPAIAVGAFLVEFMQDGIWIYSLGTAFSYSLSVFVVTLILKKGLSLDSALERVEDVGKFLVVAVMIGSLISSSLTTFSLCISNLELWSEFSRIWNIRWLGDGLGIAVLGSTILVWFSPSRINWSNRQIIEVFIWISTLVCLCLLIFRNWAPTDTLRYPLELAMFPVIVQ